MRNVSDTIARLAAFRARLGALPTDGASTDRLSPFNDFGSNPGGLDARFYLPDAMTENAPLVVVLHGCTQTAGGYDTMAGWSKLADETSLGLLYPQQSRSNNPNLCFNWFSPEDAARDRGEALSIRQMVEAMIARHGLDRRRVFVTGLSAGGAMAVSMLSNYPEVFAGGGIIAGLPHGSAKSIPEAFDRMRGHGGPSEQELQRLLARASTHHGPWPRVSIWHGSADKTVAHSNADAIAGQWRGVHGLDDAPPSLTTAGTLTKRVWHDETGIAVLEINMIAGMGHGTPLDGELGAAGPYMLDVGISSTREIARFWGLTPMAAKPPRHLNPWANHRCTLLNRVASRALQILVIRSKGGHPGAITSRIRQEPRRLSKTLLEQQACCVEPADEIAPFPLGMPKQPNDRSHLCPHLSEWSAAGSFDGSHP